MRWVQIGGRFALSRTVRFLLPGGRVLPDVVEFEANGRDGKGLDYNRLIPVVVEAMKEQQEQIAMLMKRLAEIEALAWSQDPTAEICRREY